MRGLLAIVVILGLALGGALAYLGASDGVPPDEPAPDRVASAEPQSESDLPASVLFPPVEHAPPPAAAPRNVTPPGILPPPAYSTPPRRVAPPARPVAVEPPREEPDEPERFFRVVVRDAGTIEADGLAITLAGIETRPLDATCKDGAGGAWPCGRHAATALSRLIRARAIECDMVERQEQAARAACRVADTDLSAWLVAQGWAEPASGDYAEELEAAREAHLGFWREGSPATN